LGNALVNSYKGQSRLVIPLTDFIPSEPKGFIIKALQFIDKDGNKRFSGSFKGLFHVASDYNAYKDIIVIAEGYATARSIVQALDTESKPLDSCTYNTGSRNFLVLAAMSACNLKNVVEKISKQLPDSRIVIAADNDEAGRNVAQGVSDIPNVQIVYPTQGFKDFNDMYQAVGAEEVNSVFYSFMRKENENV
jgi:phage/plasmid primase-like uncharacterized protein